MGYGAGIGDDDAIDAGFFESFDGGSAEYGVCGAEEDTASSVCADNFDSAANGPGSGDHVIEDEGRLTFDGATDEIGLTGFHGICAAFVDDGERAAEVILVLESAFDTAFVGADDDEFFAGDVKRSEVSVENWGSVEVVDRYIEEALDLSCVQVHGEDAVSTGLNDEVSNKFGGDGNAAGVLAVLASVSEIRNDRGNTSSAGTAAGVNHYQQFNKVFVDWWTGGLDEEYIAAADVLIELNADFAVGEVADFEVSESDAKVSGDLAGEFGIGTAAEDCQMFVHTC